MLWSTMCRLWGIQTSNRNKYFRMGQYIWKQPTSKGLSYFAVKLCLWWKVRARTYHQYRFGCCQTVFDGGSLYCASNTLKMLFDGLEKEVRKDNKIKVSVVYSGVVDTHFHKEKRDPYQAISFVKDIANSIYFILSAPERSGNW